MADDSTGKSIADAYRNWTDDAATARPSAGASIADAYRAQAATTPPAAKSWQDEYFPAPTQAQLGDVVPQADNPLSRIIGAGAEGFRTGPRIIDQPAIDQAERAGPVGYYINSPLMQVANLPLRGLGAVFKGGQATIDEALKPLNPLLGTNFSRDIAALPEAFPFGFSALRPPGRPPIPEAPPPGPRFVSEVTAPLRPPDMTDAARINQLVEHAVNEEQPAVGPPMARGPLTQETVQPAPSSGAQAAGAAQPAATSGTIPITSDAAKAVASAYYNTFDRAAQEGGSLTPQATNKFIASVEAAAPKPGIGQAVAGKNTITDLVERLQDYKNQPMSLQDAHVVDQQLGNLITAEYSKTGVSGIGRELQSIQHNFRDQLSNPEAGDVVSGQAGLDALAPARKAYSQAMKLDTIERIQERANMTDNPSTSFRTQIRTLLNNDRMSRGFSGEEIDALRAAANRGAAATALHVLGSRLIPIISGSTGTGAGFFGAGPVGAFLGATTGAAAGHVLNEAARAGENALATRRLRNAYTVLGKSVPPHPLQP